MTDHECFGPLAKATSIARWQRNNAALAKRKLGVVDDARCALQSAKKKRRVKTYCTIMEINNMIEVSTKCVKNLAN